MELMIVYMHSARRSTAVPEESWKDAGRYGQLMTPGMALPDARDVHAWLAGWLAG